jgi:circadian clock protein KaiB
MTRGRTSAKRPAKTGNKHSDDRYVLRLYVAGMTARSADAISLLREVCEEYLHARYDLEVIDIYQLPALAKGHQIIATPTLVRVLPEPLKRCIGGLSKEQLVFGLDLRLERNGGTRG